MTTAMTTATTTAITRTRHFSATDMGRYELIPFEVPPRTERIDISVAYTRHATTVADGITLRREQAVVDLFLHDPNDVCVGASGSERTTVFLSGTDATPGFKRQPIQSGGWAIGAGLYKIPEEGLDVTWTITLTPKPCACSRAIPMCTRITRMAGCRWRTPLRRLPGRDGFRVSHRPQHHHPAAATAVFTGYHGASRFRMDAL